MYNDRGRDVATVEKKNCALPIVRHAITNVSLSCDVHVYVSQRVRRSSDFSTPPSPDAGANASRHEPLEAACAAPSDRR